MARSDGYSQLQEKMTAARRVRQRTLFWTGCAVVLVAMIVILAGQTVVDLLMPFPWEKSAPVLETRLNLQPGNARIPRGQSLRIRVEITGKSTDEVRLGYTRMNRPSTVEDGDSPIEQQVNMVQIEGERDKFEYEIFNVNEDMQYYVLANDTDSERYTVEVYDIPKVSDIGVSYIYPEHTQLKPVVQEGDGNIRAVVGTAAEVRITANKAIQSAILTDTGNNTISMGVSEGRTLAASLDVIEDGKYSVELHCVNGFKNETPIEYSVRAIPDNPPEVVIREPGRDIKATMLEEVQVLVEASDDYKVEQTGLRYTIGSGEAQELPTEAYDVGARNTISGSYHFYLEELNVEPGDVLTYYAQAVDSNAGIGNSKIHFIEVRPFSVRYEERDAESAAGDILAGLIAAQKQIIRETWGYFNSRTRFDGNKQPAPPSDDYKVAVKKTGEKQAKLRDRVQRFVGEISTAMRTISIDPQILINFEAAIGKMRKAYDELGAIKPREAMPREQEALELLVTVEMKLPKTLTRLRGSVEREVADNMEVEIGN